MRHLENDLALPHQVRPAAAAAGPHPGLVLFHGLGSSEGDLMLLGSQIDPRVFVVSARAPLPYRWGGYMWYDVEREGPALGGKSITSTLSLLDRFLDEVVETYGIDPGRLYTGGFSMGAAMAGALALLHPDRVAGAIMISGFLPPDPAGKYRSCDAAGHPFFQAHGTRDTVLSIEFGRMTRDFLRRTPVRLTYREYPIGHEVSAEELADLRAWLSTVLE